MKFQVGVADDDLVLISCNGRRRDADVQSQEQ
jgi:hypothetical protein